MNDVIHAGVAAATTSEGTSSRINILECRDDLGRRTVDRLVEEIPRLRRYARHLVGSAELADDVVNDCLVRALDRLESWQPGSNLRAWLFVILRNCLHDEHRRAKRRPVVDIEVAEEHLPQVSGGQEVSVMLDEAFSRLRDEHQEVIYLVAIEGRPYEETAAHLDVCVGTVRSRLSRAREALRQALETS